jgi:nucleotide-binding universal stress UspA family protein
MNRKIVVGVDFSSESEVAARQATEIARHTGSELVLVHCGDTVELPELGENATQAGREAFELYRAALARALAADRERLAALRERLSGQGPIVSQLMSEGLPDGALHRAAEELAADLIVVGTHGRTGLRWFMLGSVAEHVVRSSSVDVLVARGEGAGRGGFQRILVATDFTPPAERALDRALELAGHGAHVEVVHFLGMRLPARYHVGITMAPLVPPDRLELEITASVRERGAALLGSRRRPGIELSFQAVPGAPVPSIVHRLEGSPYDLAALGSHGRRGFRRFALGSVAETVVRRAPCSVLIARGAPA